MTGYRVVNLRLLIETKGEDIAKSILSTFSCPLNPDVEYFLRVKAIEFACHGWAQTHFVFASLKGEWVLVGYFSLANKHITISSKIFGQKSRTLRKRIAAFSTYDPVAKAYVLTAPLIAQLGKNFANGYNKLITGDELLSEACNKISRVQFDLGGRFAYVECEDKPALVEFYTENGFVDFDQRKLDADETERLSGDYLVQLLKYIR